MKLLAAFSFGKQRTVLLLLFLMNAALNVVAQPTAAKPDSVTNKVLPFIRSSYCQAPSLYPYKPEELSSLKKLPDSVLMQLKAYLIGRLGEEFYNSISFNSGQYVDLEALHKLEGDNTSRKWTVAAYYLCFTCKQLTESNGYYTASLELDAAGRIILPVNLPYIVQDTAKARAISWQAATTIARRNGIRKVAGSFYYSPPLDVMIWGFHSSKQIRRGLTREKEIYIQANTGQILKKGDYQRRYAPF